MKRKDYVLIVLVLMLFGWTSSIQSQTSGVLDIKDLQNYWADQYNQLQPKDLTFNILKSELKAKATPDGCYFGVGSNQNYYNPAGIDCDECTTLGGIPKTNQAYVWGLTQESDKLFFGTGPNIHCLVLGGYLGLTSPIETDCWVCEFGEGPFTPPIPPQIGDWRPPRLYTYNTLSGEEIDITPPDPGISEISGIRSAGSLNGVALLGGPLMTGGIKIYAYNTETNEYLGSTTMLVVPGTATGVTNIRKWVVIDDVLYLGLGTMSGGSVLRWNGDLADPFLFEQVGVLDGQAAELAEHDGKLFVATWPGLAGKANDVAGLWMSPEIQTGGLTTADANSWQKVWQTTDFEPDPVVAATYGGGALKSFGGKLYWGTMHVPFVSTFAHFQLFPPATLEDSIAGILGTYRAISLFSGDDFGTPDEHIDLLYGNHYLPKYTHGTGWELVPNNMGATPLYGPAGIWNLFNNYTWTMDLYKSELYVGTMDWSFLLYGTLGELFAGAFSFELKDGTANYKNIDGYNIPSFFFGADLFRFPTPDVYAVPVSLNGMGNDMNYGIRTMVADEDHLYLGTANPMNLDPQGGWEIIELSEDEYTFDFQEYNQELVTKNEPDETFYGLGDPRNYYNPNAEHFTTDSTIAKHNQSYVWGMTAAEDNIWIGTGPNVLQLVMGAYLQMPEPHQTDSWAAEFGLSQFSPPLPDIIGDWRPARVFRWDETTQTRTEHTPSFVDAPELQSTLGLRSAGTIGDLVILAGSNIATDFGVNFLAYNNNTGEFLGSHQIKNIEGDPVNNIRKWITIDGQSYTGISGSQYGYILKWTGTIANPFQFEVVGEIDAAPAEFTYHEGRLVTSCWPGGGELGSPNGGLPSVWYSPVIPSGGLTTANRFQWDVLWESSDYEVDPVMARMMAGGAIESLDGKLYWGTMHVPFMASLAHLKVYFEDFNISPDETDIINAILYGHRAISIFRADNLGEVNEEIELLYGEEYVSAYSPMTGWQMVPNASGLVPQYGPAGFGSAFNNYTWTMKIFDEQLFIGTMDWSYLIGSLVPAFLEGLVEEYLDGKGEITLEDIPLFHIPVPFEGADVWRISGSNSVAMPVTLNGVGNPRNYGIRTMATTGDKLYLGTANAMNLHPQGGWELYALTDVEADFVADKPVANPYDNISFHPLVDGSQLYSVHWEFPGGTPSYSNERYPEVYYDTPGDYSVTMYVEKLGQSLMEHKSEYISVVAPDEAQCMEFYEGWGGVSSYMIPVDPTLVNLMQPLINNPYFGNLVVMLSENGIFWPDLGINTILNWDTFKGYKVKMTSIANNCMFGEPVEQNNVTIQAGTHFIPILSMEPVSAYDMFNDAPLIFAYNLYNGEIYWPQGGIYTLNILYPGLAYLVMLSEEHTFIFPQSDATPDRIARMPKHEFVNPTEIWNDPLNTGVSHIFSIYAEALQDFSAGDVIGAFDADGNCVGMTRIKSTQENLPLIVYGDDETTPETDGMKEGNLIHFRVTGAGNSAEKEMTASFDTELPHHNGRYSTHGLSGIKALREGSTGLAANELPGLDIYPNPASDMLNIVLPGNFAAKATIYNTQGQLMMSSDLVSGENTLDIGTLQSGVYFIEISGQEKIITRRLVKQ